MWIGFVPSRRRYVAAAAAMPAASATSKTTRRHRRGPDGATVRSGRGVGFLRASPRPPVSAAGGSLSMTASSAASITPASLNRADGFFAIARSITGWNDAATASPGRTFASDGIGWVRCAMIRPS